MAQDAPRPFRVAYFSMEIGLEPEMPTYSGGLGVLAGDIVRAAADLSIPMIGMTLLHRKGYFFQKIDEMGRQSEKPFLWQPEKFLEPMEPRARIEIEGRPVQIRAWRYVVEGVAGHRVPVFLLDTDLPENDEYARTLTDHLYGGDDRYRLCQESLLGQGGLAMLRTLGYDRLDAYHMNEGHSALLGLALLQERKNGDGLKEVTDFDLDRIRSRCLFTTHTPVPAGHDQFPMEMARKVLGDEQVQFLQDVHCCLDETLNMTYLALFFAGYVNGVSLTHEEISQNMFPNYPIGSITNGVHAVTWTAPSFQELFDRHMPEWRFDSLYLRYAVSIPLA